MPNCQGEPQDLRAGVTNAFVNPDDIDIMDLGQDLHIGYELECNRSEDLTSSEPEDRCDICYNYCEDSPFSLALAELPESLTCTFDGSAGREFKTPILPRREREQYLEDVCETLKSQGYDGNQRCGAHIHIGLGGASATLKYRVYAMFVAYNQLMLHSIIPEMRNRSHVGDIEKIYKEAYGDEVEELIQFLTREEQPPASVRNFVQGKYGFALRGNFNTIEIRYLEGSLDAQRLCHWADFTTGVVDWVRRSYDKKVLMEVFEHGKKLKQFCEKEKLSHARNRAQKMLEILNIEQTTKEYLLTNLKI